MLSLGLRGLSKKSKCATVDRDTKIYAVKWFHRQLTRFELFGIRRTDMLFPFLVRKTEKVKSRASGGEVGANENEVARGLN